MRPFAARSATALLVAALLAPVFGAGAVLADDLRDMAAGNTGLADNPETPGPDLYAPRIWGTDIPDMPSLLVLDAPADPAIPDVPRPVAHAPAVPRALAPCAPAPRSITARGPPALLA
ncbi:MAG TPA: hypothetical protein VMN04_11550 [Thermoanaerobaculia bacterium]|nr:hypothetical protein [Thermoanaerobaculia bacterium]